MGQSSKLGVFNRKPRERTIPICVIGRFQIGWEEIEHGSNLENPYERR